ncbi:MAG: transport protein [Rhodoglobus sp.]|nr:transport protein [Rhodoglobus sp.]
MLFVVLTSVWGSSFFFTAIALDSFGPGLIALLRVCIGTLVLGVVLVALRARLPAPGRVYLHALLLGAISIAAPFLLITLAQQHLNSSLATILVSTTPIFVYVMVAATGAGGRFSPVALVGIVVSFVGVASLYAGQDSLGTDGWFWPLVAVLCACLFAAGNVYTRRFLRVVPPITLAFLQMAAALIFLAPAVLATEPFPAAAPSSLAVLAVLELGVLGSALAYMIFSLLIQTWGSTATSINTYLQPIVGVMLGVGILGEVMSPSGWLSVVVILGGVLLFGTAAVREAARRKREPPPPTGF